MRLAIVGKGGVGKTTLAGILSRVLARRGRRVLAVDFDPNPGLAFALGLPPSDAGLPEDALEEVDPKVAPYGWRLRSGLSPAEVVERYSLAGADGVRYLTPGKIDRPGHVVGRSIGAVRTVVGAFDDLGWDVIGDLEAGTTSPYEGFHRFADLALVVVTPGWTSALTLRRLLPLLGDMPTMVVGSRFPPGRRPEHVEVDAIIPDDPEVAAADRLGVAPLDHCPEAPAVRAVESLVDRLVGEEVRA